MEMSNNTANNATPGRYTDISTYEAGIIQASVHRILQKACDDILRPYGITKAQWFIIGTILDAGDKGIRLTELAGKTDTTLAYLTNAINLLESKEFLVRQSEKVDSRAKRIVVHPDFKELCCDIEGSLRKGLRELLFKNIDPAEFQVYMKVLRQLSEVST